MSGLAMLLHRDGRPVEPSAMWAMLEAAPYRGPDGMAVRCWGPLGFGHAKLTVSLEDIGETQPLVSPRTGCAIISDARLDNRDDLLARLPDDPQPTTSDAELILRAYETWGVDAVDNLLGDFAFAVWDPRHQRLVCARDTSGQRCLFYRIDSRTFAAASEIQQLVQDPAVSLEPDEERLRDYLVPLNMIRNEKDRADTFYKGIHALAAADVLVVAAQQFVVRRYWELQPPAPVRYQHDDEYAEHFQTLFAEAVRTRLRSNHPVGVLLSGGLDSASVACTSQELIARGAVSSHGFASFTSVFDDPACDERTYVADVHAKYGFPTYLVPTSGVSSRLQLAPRGFQESPDIVVAEDPSGPFATALGVGVRALLTGDVADAYVPGSRMVFDSLVRQGRWRRFWEHARAARRSSHMSLRTLGLACLVPMLPIPIQRGMMIAHVRRLYRRHGDAVIPHWMADPVRTDLSRRNVGLLLRAEQQRRFSNPGQEQAYRMLWPPELARHPAPWPVEMRRPFADRRLHEFALAIPPEQHFRPHPHSNEFYAGSKWLVRRAMRGVLPESIRTRTVKTGFTVVLEREIEDEWSACAKAFGPGGRSELVARGYVDQARFWARLQELRAGAGPARDLLYVTRMLGLETWLRALQLPHPQRVLVPDAQRALIGCPVTGRERVPVSGAAPNSDLRPPTAAAAPDGKDRSNFVPASWSPDAPSVDLRSGGR